MTRTRVLVRVLSLVGVLAGVVLISVGLARQGNDPQTIAERVANLIAENPAIKIDRDPGQLVGVIEIDITGIETNAFANLPAYRATPEMESLINHLELTRKGRQLLDENRPEFISRTEMAGLCGSRARGCFVHIHRADTLVDSYITLVDDLAHEKQVEVLAHELLHAVYESIDDKFLINALIDEAYETNQVALDRRLEPYGRQTDEKRYHELHSFIGSTINGLSGPFEDHYRQHLSNRQLVLTHAPGGDHSAGSPPLAAAKPKPEPAPAPQPDPDPPTPPRSAPQPPAPAPDSAQDCRNAGGDWTGQACDYRRRDCERSGGSWFGDSCDRPADPDPDPDPEPDPEPDPPADDSDPDIIDLSDPAALRVVAAAVESAYKDNSMNCAKNDDLIYSCRLEAYTGSSETVNWQLAHSPTGDLQRTGSSDYNFACEIGLQWDDLHEHHFNINNYQLLVSDHFLFYPAGSSNATEQSSKIGIRNLPHIQDWINREFIDPADELRLTYATTFCGDLTLEDFGRTPLADQDSGSQTSTAEPTQISYNLRTEEGCEAAGGFWGEGYYSPHCYDPQDVERYDDKYRQRVAKFNECTSQLRNERQALRLQGYQIGGRSLEAACGGRPTYATRPAAGYARVCSTAGGRWIDPNCHI